VVSSPSLLSSLFHIERRGSEGGGVDEWDEEEGEWEVNEEGEAVDEEEEKEEEEEEREEKEEEASGEEEEEGLADLTWWEVLGESPPNLNQESQSEEGGERGRTGRRKGRRTRIRSRRRRSSSSSSGSSSRRGATFQRNRVDHLWEIFSPPPPPSPPFSPHPLLSSIASVSENRHRGRRDRGGLSQILIKERSPGADVWDVYMGSNGKLRRRPRWCVFGC
jgi:hypothetical protein